MSLYKLTQNDQQILRTSDGVTIPLHEGNRDYQEYYAWLQEGNEPLPADPLPPVGEEPPKPE